MRMFIKDIGEFCKMYRTHILKLTLKEMSALTGINLQTISSFENGRSTNSEHITRYYNLSKTEEQKAFFKDNIPYGSGDW